MAPSMRTWLIVAGGGALLLALWALPPVGVQPWGLNSPFPEEVAAIEARRELRNAASHLTRLRWADSIEAVLRRDGGAVVTHLWAEVEPAAAARLRAQVEVELGALPRRADLVTGVVVLDSDFLTPLPELPHGAVDEEYVRGIVDGRPYCVAVHTSGPWLTAEGVDVTLARDLLGPCAFLAAYGEPGAGIEAWLARAGWNLGSLHASAPEAVREWRAWQAEALSGDPPRFGQRAHDNRWFPSVGLHACLGGDDAHCRALLLEPYRDPGTPPATADVQLLRVDPARWSGVTRALGGAGPTLLAELERRHGSERFAAFWRSEGPVEEAFEDAFGVPMAAWARDWVEVLWPPITAGPSPRGRELAFSLLWLALAAGVGVVATRRRRVA